MKNYLLLLPLAFLTTLQVAQAASFSFSGNFTQDDNVQYLTVTVSAPSSVSFITHSYAGGSNAAGVNVSRGGFDPSLALFSSTGSLLSLVDDGTCSQVGTDVVSGQCFDSYLKATLNAGTYTLALTEFDNDANGPTLSAGFARQGAGNFTGPAFGPVGATGPFYDLFGNQRTSSWQVDVVNASSAALTSPVPEPAAFSVVGFGLVLGMAFRGMRRRA